MFEHLFFTVFTTFLDERLAILDSNGHRSIVERRSHKTWPSETETTRLSGIKARRALPKPHASSCESPSRPLLLF